VAHVLWTEPRHRLRAWTRGAMATLAGCALLASASVLAARWHQREPELTLNGLAAMERRWPGDAAAVRYLWHHARPDDVVLDGSDDRRPWQLVSAGVRYVVVGAV